MQGANTRTWVWLIKVNLFKSFFSSNGNIQRDFSEIKITTGLKIYFMNYRFVNYECIRDNAVIYYDRIKLFGNIQKTDSFSSFFLLVLHLLFAPYGKK